MGEELLKQGMSGPGSGERQIIDVTEIVDKVGRGEELTLEEQAIYDDIDFDNIHPPRVPEDNHDENELSVRFEESQELFIVRLYDGFDNEWIDITGAITKEEADRVWNEKTKNGTEKTCYGDIDYYRIFPANTIMKYSLAARQLSEEEHDEEG
jgi:hypothetical protein